MRSEDGETPTVYIVDDDPAMREMLAQMLVPLQVRVETFASAEAFLAAYVEGAAGCLVLDMRLPGMDGLSLFNTLKARGSALPVIFVTGYADVPTARQVLLSGAADFLQKPVEKRLLLDSVQGAFAQGSERRAASRLSARLDHLTQREWQVMRLVVAGKPNKLISAELGISQKTVEAHRARVMAKTRAESVADLVRMFSAFEGDALSLREGREAEAPRKRA